MISLGVYLLSVATFLGTIVLYNPENAFGDTIIDSPSSSVIKPQYSPGCSGLTPYATSEDIFTSFSGSGIPVLLSGKFQLGVTYTPVPNSTSATDLPLLKADGSVLGNETILNGLFVSRDDVNFTIDIINVLVVPVPLRLSGDPDECASFFTEVFLQRYDETCATGCLQDDFFERSAYFRIDLQNPSAAYQMRILPFSEAAVFESMKALYCSQNSFFDLDAQVAPYSCVVLSFRGWFEVLALSFSNASLLYAFLVSLGYCVLEIYATRHEKDIDL